MTNPDFSELAEEMLLVRRQIHQFPELAFSETRTAELVAALLSGWGYTVSTGIGGTGVVGQLRCGKSPRSLGIRADMDALPIEEKTGLPYASVNTGVMHACGHDGHTAMLLGAAKYLGLTRQFSGTLNLIFQPAEEKGFDSGAVAMLRDGLFDRFPCDRIYAIHNQPGVDEGVFLFRDGGFLAAGDRVFVKVFGKGGHAARPHQSIDPVLVASTIVVALQSIVSRTVDPDDAAVVTVSRFIGGHALNVIPDVVELGMSVRTFDESTRQAIKERILRLIESTAIAHGALTEIEYVAGYPVTLNAFEPTQFAAGVAAKLFGEQRVVLQAKRSMGSEDFAYMLQRVPGSMIRLGNGLVNEGAGLHHSKYDFNDRNLIHGIQFWCALAGSFLGPSASPPQM